MSVRPPADCENMDQVRAEIDRLDLAILDLVAERFGYVDRAWQLKTHRAEAVVPWRIQQVIDRVRARAQERGVPPELAEARQPPAGDDAAAGRVVAHQPWLPGPPLNGPAKALVIQPP